jgi:hypothetical protein
MSKLHFFLFYFHAFLFRPEECDKRKRWAASRLIIKKAPGCPKTT